MLSSTGKQVVITTDVPLCLYGTGSVILITSWPGHHVASPNIQLVCNYVHHLC